MYVCIYCVCVNMCVVVTLLKYCIYACSSFQVGDGLAGADINTAIFFSPRKTLLSQMGPSTLELADAESQF